MVRWLSGTPPLRKVIVYKLVYCPHGEVIIYKLVYCPRGEMIVYKMVYVYKLVPTVR